MPTPLQIDFPMQSPWGDEMAEAFRPLAELIGETPCLRWKICTESRGGGEGGGIDRFGSRVAAEAYPEEHTTQLNGSGVMKVRAHPFDVNLPLTAVSHRSHAA